MITDKHHRMCYSIGGVIANLAYNGDEFWGDVQPSRHSMLDFMVSVTGYAWNVNFIVVVFEKVKEMQQWNIEGEIWIEFKLVEWQLQMHTYTIQ